jgi:hypothetical protein
MRSPHAEYTGKDSVESRQESREQSSARTRRGLRTVAARSSQSSPALTRSSSRAFNCASTGSSSPSAARADACASVGCRPRRASAASCSAAPVSGLGNLHSKGNDH